jgi:hypothetical protein
VGSTELTIILPLVGGFYFILRCQVFYLVSLQLGQAVAVLLSALAASVFALTGRLLVIWLASTPWHAPLYGFAKTLWPVQFTGTALAAFALSVACAETLRFALKIRRVNAWIINTFGDSMIRLMHSSMVQVKAVAITLDTRKIYVGFVQEIPSLNPTMAYVCIMPIMSGYRDQNDLTFKFTTHYGKALASATNRADYITVIPLSTVKIANLFDTNTHEQNFAAKPTIHVTGL